MRNRLHLIIFDPSAEKPGKQDPYAIGQTFQDMGSPS